MGRICSKVETTIEAPPIPDSQLQLPSGSMSAVSKTPLQLVDDFGSSDEDEKSVYKSQCLRVANLGSDQDEVGSRGETREGAANPKIVFTLKDKKE